MDSGKTYQIDLYKIMKYYVVILLQIWPIKNCIPCSEKLLKREK